MESGGASLPSKYPSLATFTLVNTQILSEDII